MTDAENIILYEFTEEESPGRIRAALGELFPVFEQRSLVKANPNTGRLSLDYCGFATSGKKLVTILPKYLRDRIGGITNPDEKLRQQTKEAGKLYRLLKRNEYGLRNRKNVDIAAADFINENSAGFTNELAIADFILSDYQNNGLWAYSAKKVLLDANGETDWELTVNNTDAVISGGNPIYFNTYSSADELITDSLITQIHKYSINYCNRRYGFLLDLEMSELPHAAQHPEELGDSWSLVYALEKQLRITYRERDILLLKALTELIETGFSQSDEAISLYGRRDFEQVWEAALQYCFGHEPKLRQQLFPVPEWFDKLTGRFLAVNINDTLKPDVLRRITAGGRDQLLILDAKYYLLNYDSKSTFPPVGDIIKQYFYEAVVCRKEIGWLPEYVVNAFIFPSQKPQATELETAGHARLDNDMFRLVIAAGSIKKPVLTFNADPERIFERYTRWMPFSMQELHAFTLSATNHMNTFSV